MKKKSEKVARVPDLPPAPKFDQEPLTSSDEDIPMYFTKPDHLLDIFQVCLYTCVYAQIQTDVGVLLPSCL